MGFGFRLWILGRRAFGRGSGSDSFGLCTLGFGLGRRVLGLGGRCGLALGRRLGCLHGFLFLNDRSLFGDGLLLRRGISFLRNRQLFRRLLFVRGIRHTVVI